MNLFSYILSISFLYSLFTCSAKIESDENNIPRQSNVLFIAIDDLNDWIGCLDGHPNSKTPNIDRLAEKGVLFANAQCQAPNCGPSRASVMTGLRPSTSGIYGQIDDNNIKMDNPVTEDIIFLPEYFKNHGYHTMGIGKLFHHHAPDGLFDESGGRFPGFGPTPEERFVWDGYGTADRDKYGRTSTDWGAYPDADSLMPDHQSANWAIERLKRDYNKPFFLSVGFLRPHVPWYVPQKWFDMHPLDSIIKPPYLVNDLEDVPEIALQITDLPFMPSTEWANESGEWPKIIQAYLACISFVDFYVGEILSALENSKYAENTIVVIWSDHGYRLGEKGSFAKHSLWEEATNAPLIFSGPGIQQGKMVNSPAEMLSIYPTLLDLCGIVPYGRNEGINLAPLLRGENKKVGEYALTTFGWGNHSIKTDSFRYIHYRDGSEEFYDHRNDPNEWYNIASNEDSNDKIEMLKKYLPEVNNPYAKHSSNSFNPYFRMDKVTYSQ
jgi:iduronate 2-sulfatase